MEDKLAISTEKMIQMIKDSPCIWDRTDVGYKDKLRRERAWTDIYKELYPNFDELKEGQKIKIGQQLTKKWFNIRDAYVKSMKDPKRRPYIHAQALDFLDPVISGDRQNIQEFLEDQSIDQSFDGEPEVWLNESFVDVGDNGAKRPKLELKEEDNETIVAFFSRMVQREEDEDRAFFNSITPQVKTLSDNSKLKFRIQVMKLLKKLKNDDKLVIKTHDSDSE